MSKLLMAFGFFALIGVLAGVLSLAGVLNVSEQATADGCTLERIVIGDAPVPSWDALRAATGADLPQSEFEGMGLEERADGIYGPSCPLR